MNEQLEKAVEILKKENHSCVLIKDNVLSASDDFGVKPLMSLLRKDRTAFQNGVIADKVVGKAAAMLAISGGAAAVYGAVMSEPAAEILKKSGIYFSYDELAPNIKNRKGDGLCPLEKAVLDIQNPDDAFDILEDAIKELMKNKN